MSNKFHDLRKNGPASFFYFQKLDVPVTLSASWAYVEYGYGQIEGVCCFDEAERWKNLCMFFFFYVYVYVYVCIYICIHVYSCMHMYAYVCMVCIHNTYIHIRTCTKHVDRGGPTTSTHNTLQTSPLVVYSVSHANVCMYMSAHTHFTAQTHTHTLTDKEDPTTSTPDALRTASIACCLRSSGTISPKKTTSGFSKPVWHSGHSARVVHVYISKCMYVLSKHVLRKLLLLWQDISYTIIDIFTFLLICTHSHI